MLSILSQARFAPVRTCFGQLADRYGRRRADWIPRCAAILPLNFDQRRLDKFIALFPDAIDIIVRGVRSGPAGRRCLNIIGREMPDPVGSGSGW